MEKSQAGPWIESLCVCSTNPRGLVSVHGRWQKIFRRRFALAVAFSPVPKLRLPSGDADDAHAVVFRPPAVKTRN